MTSIPPSLYFSCLTVLCFIITNVLNVHNLSLSILFCSNSFHLVFLVSLSFCFTQLWSFINQSLSLVLSYFSIRNSSSSTLLHDSKSLCNRKVKKNYHNVTLYLNKARGKQKKIIISLHHDERIHFIFYHSLFFKVYFDSNIATLLSYVTVCTRYLFFPFTSSLFMQCWAGRITSWNQDCWEKYQ